MIEDFIYALQNFRQNKLRTFLSVLGVIIGVASVIVIMSLGESSTKKIENTFGSSGLNIVSISTGFMRRGRDAVTLTFNENFREELFNTIPDIKKIWYKNSMSATISYGQNSVSSNCTAIEDGYLEMYGLTLSDGSYFSTTDNVMGTQKIILGNTIASALFPNGDAVGKNVTLVTSSTPFNFKVTGVLKEQTSGMEDSDTGIYIPRGFYAKKITPNPSASTVMVQAVDSSKTARLVTVLEEYCKQKSGTEGSVSVTSMQSMIEQMSEITSTMSIMLSAIAAISLLVGGIGIMNIMIVTVTERRQEIGIRKALGASPQDIKKQFLIEASAITILGGLIGIFIGIIISLAVEYVQSQSFAVSYVSCIVSFVFSVFVGIFFGLSPASKASKLDPVEVLSS